MIRHCVIVVLILGWTYSTLHIQRVNFEIKKLFLQVIDIIESLSKFLVLLPDGLSLILDLFFLFLESFDFTFWSLLYRIFLSDLFSLLGFTSWYTHHWLSVVKGFLLENWPIRLQLHIMRVTWCLSSKLFLAHEVLLCCLVDLTNNAFSLNNLIWVKRQTIQRFKPR